MKTNELEDDSLKKPRWQRFVESSGGAAFITVVIGGLMGSLVTAVFQWTAKGREMNSSAYQQFLDKRQDAVKTIYDSIGNSFSAASDIIIFRTSPGFNTKDKNTLKEFDSLFEKYKEGRQKWSVERKKAVFLLAFYYKNNLEVKNAWKKIEERLNNLYEITDNCVYFSNCSEYNNKETELDEAINTFAVEIEKSQDYPWEKPFWSF